MTNLTPFLLFDGHCAQAMAFYHDCLGGDIEVTLLKDTPMKSGVPAELHGRVVYAHLKSGAIEFSATDWLHPTRKPHPGNMVGLHVTGSYDEVKAIFSKLAVGADPDLQDDLHELPFGLYGHLADRYGVHWFFNGKPEPKNVQ